MKAAVEAKATEASEQYESSAILRVAPTRTYIWKLKQSRERERRRGCCVSSEIRKKMEIKLLQYKSETRVECVCVSLNSSLLLASTRINQKLSHFVHKQFLMFLLCWISFSMPLSHPKDLNMCNYIFIFSHSADSTFFCSSLPLLSLQHFRGILSLFYLFAIA